MSENGRGCFISLEGISGCGKSTLAKKWLVPFLSSIGVTSVHNAEPTSANAFGIAIRMAIERQTFGTEHIQDLKREIVHLLGKIDPFDGSEALSHYLRHLAHIPKKLERCEPLSELDRQFLFLADGALDILGTIVPKLESGIFVIQDRFHLSGAAYGSAKGELTPQEIYNWRLVLLRQKHIVPDITFFIDVAPETACERLNASGKTIDLYEGLESLRRVRTQYEEAIRVVNALEKEKSNIIRVNGENSLESVCEEVKCALLERGFLR